MLDRPICLRRLTSPNPAERDWDQIVNFTLAAPDAYSRSFILDSRGINPFNHQNPEIDALWDQLKAAPTPEEASRLSREVQRAVVHNMVQVTATTLPFIQAARDYVQGYVYERALKVRFETVWLDKPHR